MIRIEGTVMSPVPIGGPSRDEQQAAIEWSAKLPGWDAWLDVVSHSLGPRRPARETLRGRTKVFRYNRRGRLAEVPRVRDGDSWAKVLEMLERSDLSQVGVHSHVKSTDGGDLLYSAGCTWVPHLPSGHYDTVSWSSRSIQVDIAGSVGECGVFGDALFEAMVAAAEASILPYGYALVQPDAVLPYRYDAPTLPPVELADGESIPGLAWIFVVPPPAVRQLRRLASLDEAAFYRCATATTAAGDDAMVFMTTHLPGEPPDAARLDRMHSTLLSIIR